MEVLKMNDAVLQWVREMIGEREIPNNGGFVNPILDGVMRRVGFENGWAWCALFAEAAWAHPTYSGKSKVLASITDNCSANAVRTLENFEKDDTGLFKVSKIAKPGSMVIFEKRRDGEPSKTKNGVWTYGHAGIVEDVKKTHFMAVEGNTNDSGGREGIEVARKKRSYNFDGDRGLCVKGFIECLTK